MSWLNHDYKCCFLFVLRFENKWQKFQYKNRNLIFNSCIYINRAIYTITLIILHYNTKNFKNLILFFTYKIFSLSKFYETFATSRDQLVRFLHERKYAAISYSVTILRKYSLRQKLCPRSDNATYIYIYIYRSTMF